MTLSTIVRKSPVTAVAIILATVLVAAPVTPPAPITTAGRAAAATTPVYTPPDPCRSTCRPL